MISKVKLGAEGPVVSGLCFGTLTLSESQGAFSFEKGGELLSYAFNKGINFWDTAEIYGTYGHIGNALSKLSRLPVISTKSYSWDEKTAEESLEKARREMNLDRIDIFMLHEQPSVMTMLGHIEALKYFIKKRDEGVIGCVGISTHAIEPVVALAVSRRAISTDDLPPVFSEFDLGLFREIDVVHPIINMAGIGLFDGTMAEMEKALRAVHGSGVGVFGMKLLGGGNLLNEYDEAIKYGLSLDFVDSFAIGMQSTDEVDNNIDMFSGKFLSSEKIKKIKSKERKLMIEDWCTGCGSCEKRCRLGAISVMNGRAVVDSEICVLCSYCAKVCPEFAIKVV